MREVKGREEEHARLSLGTGLFACFFQSVGFQLFVSKKVPWVNRKVLIVNSSSKPVKNKTKTYFYLYAILILRRPHTILRLSSSKMTALHHAIWRPATIFKTSSTSHACIRPAGVGLRNVRIRILGCPSARFETSRGTSHRFTTKVVIFRCSRGAI